MNFSYPAGFPAAGEMLTRELIVRDPAARLGCEARGGYGPLKAHPFFAGIAWDTLHTMVSFDCFC